MTDPTHRHGHDPQPLADVASIKVKSRCDLCTDPALFRIESGTRALYFCQEHGEYTGELLVELAHQVDGASLAEWLHEYHEEYG